MAKRFVTSDAEPIFGRHCCRSWAILITVLFFAGAQISGQQISFKPMAFGIHRFDGGTWTPEIVPITLLGWGVTADAESEPWSASMEIGFMRFFGLEPFPNRFTPEKGYSWSSHMTGSRKERDSNYADMIISYKTKRLEALFGKFSRSWGPGRSALMISHKPPSYPQFGFEWEVLDNLHFSYFHGKLYSGLPDSSRIFIYQGREGPSLDRYVVAHRLEWSPIKNLKVAATETVIYGGRSMELIYLMPFILFMSAENFMQDLDNVVMGLDIAWHLRNNLKVYGAFMMDDWKPEATFSDSNRNMFGWQAGLDWSAVLWASDWLALEYTWTDYRIYRHLYPINYAYSHDYPLGFWAGPHAQALEFEYGFEWRGFRVVFNLTDVKRGQVTALMIKEKYKGIVYERFEGPTERLRNIGLAVEKEVWPRIWIEGGFSRIRWENPGFQLFSDDQTTKDPVHKSSVTIGVYYNFRVQGARHPYR